MPRIRAALEYVNFLILFVLYVQAVEGLNEKHLNARELVFIIYALCTFLCSLATGILPHTAYSLDKLAAIREHGLKGWTMITGDARDC